MPETRPILTVDVLLFTLVGERLHVALALRGREPFADRHALPGTYVRTEDADLAASATRMLADNLGLSVPHIEQLETFSGPDRDPRGWSASVAHYALVPAALLATAAPRARLVTVPAADPGALPFDHARMVARGVERIRNKSTYSALPAYLLPETFTLPELRTVYEQVTGLEFDAMRFRTNVLEQGLVREADGVRRSPGPGRPAQLYRVAGPLARDRTVFRPRGPT